MNTARNALAGAGTQTAALAFGGNASTWYNTGATEEYDGTSWTTVLQVCQQQEQFSRSRNSNCSFSFWWLASTNTAATEEWTGAAPTTVTITAS
jgi:hypothetical protein